MISEVEAEELNCKTHENRFKVDYFPGKNKKMSDTSIFSSDKRLLVFPQKLNSVQKRDFKFFHRN